LLQLPAFLKLSKDAIWGVRKGCVDNMIGVANSMTPEVRINVFVPLFDQFTKDVRFRLFHGQCLKFQLTLIVFFSLFSFRFHDGCATVPMKCLDPSLPLWITVLYVFLMCTFFFHSFPDDSLGFCFQISPDLLKKFAQIPSLTNAVVDSEVSFCCAFNFPGMSCDLNSYSLSCGRYFHSCFVLIWFLSCSAHRRRESVGRTERRLSNPGQRHQIQSAQNIVILAA
jgi:hypothetical protein